MLIRLNYGLLLRIMFKQIYNFKTNSKLETKIITESVHTKMMGVSNVTSFCRQTDGFQLYKKTKQSIYKNVCGAEFTNLLFSWSLWVLILSLYLLCK